MPEAAEWRSKLKYTLRTKLSVSYIVMALIFIVMISLITNVFLERHFRAYVKENQDNKSRDIIAMISDQYRADGTWNKEMVQNIGVNALEQGLIVKAQDVNGNTLWNAVLYNNGMCERMLAHFSDIMCSRYPNWKGAYVENEYPVMKGNDRVGMVQIGYYGPFYYTDTDLAFLNTLNKVFIGAGVFSLIIALIIGTFISSRITKPISKVINTADMISRGYYEDRSSVKSNTIEISQLSGAINHLAETLGAQEKLRKRLTADVAHELRTPMSVLRSHLEAMIDGIWKPDKERLVSCHEEIMRISRLVGDLEKLARFEGESMVLDRSRFELSRMISHIVNNFENEYVTKGVELQLEGPEVTIDADRDKMSQVMVNLLANALKFTEPGGKVEISISWDGGTAEIRVKDSGAGISEEDLPYIFERFYRADKSRNRATGGAGIGLTITKAIVDAHGGSITVNSKLGEGTEFVICIPNK